MKIPIGDDASFADATFETTGAVAVLTLTRPAKLNAMTLAMHRALFRGVKVGRSVPERLFQTVAEVLAYVYRLDRRRGERW